MWLCVTEAASRDPAPRRVLSLGSTGSRRVPLHMQDKTGHFLPLAGDPPMSAIFASPRRPSRFASGSAVISGKDAEQNDRLYSLMYSGNECERLAQTFRTLPLGLEKTGSHRRLSACDGVSKTTS